MNRFIFSSVLVFSVLSSSISARPLPVSERVDVSLMSPEQQDTASSVALKFINSYIKALNSTSNIGAWVNKNKLVTKEFKVAYKKLTARDLDADPILDAQDYPDGGYKLVSYDKKTNYVAVNPKGEDWGDYKVLIKMKNIQGKWFVDGCGIVNIPASKQGRR
ncbi:MAG: hypothetical protein ACTTJM_01250 [Bergeyella cardium]